MFDRKEIRDYRQGQALVLDESSSNNMVKAEGNSPSRASNEPHSRLPRNVGLSSRTDGDLCVISQEHCDGEYEVTRQFFKLKT